MAKGPEFEKRLRRIATRLVVRAGRAVQKAAIVADQVVTTSTPVDTGRARSNWRASLDKPASGVVGPADRSGQSAMALARTIILNFKTGVNRAIHITNNVPYIRLLDAGSSAQAPQGMTAKAIQAANDVVRRARLLD